MPRSVPNCSSVENYDSFECRVRNRVAGAKISNHGKGIAIDLRAFTLADGRRISPTDETVAKDVREALRDTACARFATVLGPGAAYHNDHVHLDTQRAQPWLPDLRMGRARAARGSRRRASSAAASATGNSPC